MREVFATGVPEPKVKLMAVIQRDIADLAFVEACRPATWKNVLTWAIVTTQGKWQTLFWRLLKSL